MTCKNEGCKSDRIASVLGKTSDLCFYKYKGVEKDGYVPYEVGIDGGDYISFEYCLECGQIQDDFPVDDPEFYADIQEGLQLVKSGDWDKSMFEEEYPRHSHLLETDDEED